MSTDLHRYLRACEQRLGVVLTIVDHHGVLHRHGRPLLGRRWQSHRNQAVCDIGFGPDCVAHCRWQINARLQADPSPCTTRCWKGVRELAVPLRWQGHHLGTLYAGCWRQGSRPRRARDLPADWLTHWEALPVYDEATTSGLAAVLELIATGLAERLALDHVQPSTDVGERIHTFLRFNCHRPIVLADLADDLGRSTSHTRALVRQHGGRPFHLLLRRYRCEAARHLLRTSTLTIAAIATAVGYEDPLYFSRCFKQETGCSPRHWRAEQ